MHFAFGGLPVLFTMPEKLLYDDVVKCSLGSVALPPLSSRSPKIRRNCRFRLELQAAKANAWDS